MSTDDLGDVRYRIDHDARILYVERYDNLTRQGIYAEWQAMQHVEGFDPAYDTLVDYSSVPAVLVSYEDVKELGRDMKTLDPRTGNVAIVSGIMHGRYFLARFYCLITNIAASRKHQVFHGKAEAEAWLFSQRG